MERTQKSGSSRLTWPGPALAIALAVVLAVVVSGCGFQLRSWKLGEAYESVALKSSGGFEIEPALRRALTQTGVPVVETDAELVLHVLDSTEELRTASVSGTARTAEFELIQRVRYAILDSDGAYLAEPTSLRASRRYFLDRGNLVGSNEEQALLRRELRTDLVQQIMRVLNTVSRSVPKSSVPRSNG